jgi:uncharacterized protein
LRQYNDAIMEYIKRNIEQNIINSLIPNKVIVITGPRRVGKTVLMQQLLNYINEPHILYNGDDLATGEILGRRSIQNYRNILGDNKLLIIDEAQKIPDIGNILKLMIDEINGLKIIVSGSSSFDIYNIMGEPLTGRKISFNLFPIAESEYSQVENRIQKFDNLKQRLVFGNYPELLKYQSEKDKSRYLGELVNSYLLKDILSFENLRNSSKIINLLRLISYQVGSEVSYQELGAKLGMSKNTIEKYLDLLTKVFVLYKLEGYSKNLRKEITKGTKWFFYDNGIRNVIIANLNPIELRTDIGQLWENYIISERIKYQKYNGMLVNNYFWRTYDKQEIDWVEERGGNLFGYEIKWKPQNVKIPSAWKNIYPEAEFQIINNENYLDWIL